jgi:hypothetical protein
LRQIKTIPLKKIVLKLSSIKQEVFSEKFFKIVLSKLDELEQNEKSLVPKKSFIPSIPIELDVPLNFYKKLFSKKPFLLMDAIIEKILIKKDIKLLRNL